MPRWTRDVFKQIRPHHLISSLKDTRRALRELRFRFTFTSKDRFITDILSLPGSPSELWHELGQTDLSSHLKERLESQPASPGRGPMGDEAELLYILTRLVKPEFVVETGVGAGYSTSHILKALDKNESGMLYSIDYAENEEPYGWLVPDDLKDRWKLYKGPSSEHLPAILDQLGGIDLFIHDSDHSYENMIWEFRIVWPHLRKGGVFLSHDVGRNDALHTFLKEIDFSWRQIKIYNWLAGLKKP